MKKVGIITLYYRNYNFGGMLQAYALREAVQKEGFLCEQIAYDRLLSENGAKKISLKDFVKNCYWTLKKLPYQLCTQKRRENFRMFQENIPHSEKVYGSFNMKECNSVYDAFICGSDQIWNDWGAKQEEVDCNTLHFVSSGKPRVAYAASTGTTSFSEEFKKKLMPGLKGLTAVSVREKSAALLIEELSGQQVKVMPDPVLLLSGEEWERVAAKMRQKEKYILCYLLGGNEAYENQILQFAKKNKLKVIFLPHDNKRKVSKDKNVVYDYSSGPTEFLALVKNAEVVMTDSFHAMLFSVIFHKLFFVFPRVTKVQGVTMNSRITDFLKEYGLEERLIDETFTEADIDYHNIDEKIKKKREEAVEFLRTSLGI